MKANPDPIYTRRVLYPHELSDEIKAEFNKGYPGETTPHLDHLMKTIDKIKAGKGKRLKSVQELVDDML